MVAGLRLLLVAAGLALGMNAIADEPRPVRVASINLCTDQLLLDLADPSQIMGLSPFARDTVRSWAAAKADGIPILSGTAEEIMMRRPTVVLAGRFTKRATREFIRQRGIPVEEFDAVQTVAQVREQIHRVAAIVGRPDRGEARVAELDAALGRLNAAGEAKGLRVLALSRRGWTSGRDSLMGELLAAGGLGNAGGDVAARSGSFMPLEAIVRLRPDALVLAREDEAAEDQGQALLLHPAIQGLFPPERRIIIPESLTICGGPMLVEAMDRLAGEVGRLKPR